MTNPDTGGAGVRLTQSALKDIFPKAPASIIKAFLEKQDVLSSVGVNQTRRRLAYFFANIHHETSGFNLKSAKGKLTENINYSAKRMAEVWPNRFSSAAAVRAKYGTGKGWRQRAFDDIYGNRMGNRPGTSDGSTYIGRGGPQITGRDGYRQISKRIGVDLVSDPERATEHWLQPDICAAFWDWKGMNKHADAGAFTACVKAWNGGTNGLADRKKQLARITPILSKLEWGNIDAGEVSQEEPEKPAAPEKPADDTPAPLAVLSVQKRLSAMNYNPSWLDDKWGGRTAGAISSFLNDRHSNITPPTSEATFVAVLPKLRAELTKAEAENFKRPMSSDLKKADPKTVSEVAPEAVPTRRNFLTSAWAAVVAFVSAFATAINEYISSLFGFYNDHKDSLPTDAGFLRRVWSYIDSVPTSIWIAVVGCLFAYIAINAMISARHTIEAVKTGARQ